MKILVFLVIIILLVAFNTGTILNKFDTFMDAHTDYSWVPEARYKLASTYFYTGKYDQAISIYMKVLKDHPKAERADNSQYMLALCYENKNEYIQAKKELEQMLAKYPDSDVKREAKEKLTRIDYILH